MGESSCATPPRQSSAKDAVALEGKIMPAVAILAELSSTSAARSPTRLLVLHPARLVDSRIMHRIHPLETAAEMRRVAEAPAQCDISDVPPAQMRVEQISAAVFHPSFTDSLRDRAALNGKQPRQVPHGYAGRGLGCSLSLALLARRVPTTA